MKSDHADAARNALERLDGDDRLAGINLTIEQIIAAEGVGGTTPEETYHVQIANGSVTVVDGPAVAPDLTISQNTETAAALRSGSVHAQTAFLTGRLTIDGDVDKLLEYGELLANLLRPA